jgi:exonuclease III
MGPADFKNLKDEIAVFKEKYLDKPPSEFRKIVKDEFSDIILVQRMKMMQKTLESIEKKVQFFMIITIIGIIGTVIAIVAGLN